MSWNGKGITRNTKPSMTDQSQADEANVNVIVRKYKVTGTVRANAKPPMYADFTEIPGDLREMIELTKELGKFRKQLPEELRELPIEKLLGMTTEEAKALFAPKPTTPPEEPK